MSASASPTDSFGGTNVPETLGSALAESVQSLSDGLLLMDREFRILFANAQARRISRLRPEDLNGPTHWEIFPTTVGTDVERKYRRVMEERVEEAFEVFYAPFAIWIRVRAFPAGEGMALSYSDVTAIRESTAAREASAKRVRSVLEATTDAVFVVDRNWTLQFMNAAARKYVAASGDVLGKGIFHAFPGMVYPDSPYVTHYFAAMNDGLAATFEASYGDPLHVDVVIQVMPTEDGIIIFARDVTKQRSDERAIRDSEEKYRLLTELGPQVVWTAAPDGRVTYGNQRIHEYLGDLEFTRDNFWLEAFAPEDQERVLGVWTHCVQTGEPYDVDARLVRASDASARWWRLQAVPRRDEMGTIVQWIGIANDIHDAKVTRERLDAERAETERQRRELEAVYDTAPVGLVLFEPEEFRYIRVNQRQAEIIGLPRDQILGKRFQEIATTDIAPALFAKVAKGEYVRDQTFTTEFHNRPGEKRSFNVNYSPVFAHDGSVRAISCAVLEITQLRRAEAALVQSEKLAAVGRLASSISHEINNPLEAITNLLYLAASDDALGQATKSYLQLAQDELGRVSQIATQTLRFHRQSNNPVAVTAAQLVDPVLNLYAGRLVNSGIHVEASYSTVSRILCFENDIRQVLNNLIANAIDAMRTGGRLVVRAHDASHAQTGTAGVRIAVADTGHGMGRETMERIFEPFYTTKGLNGNGLGLWISKGIVERHGGCLRVRSIAQAAGAQGLHGTIFTLFLPGAA